MIEKQDYTIADVNKVYDGVGGLLWEMLMGEEIHIGGSEDTEVLADKAGVDSSQKVLDVCSALGGPARHIASKYNCQVVGLDATMTMFQKALERTIDAGLENRVTFKLGNALDMPFHSGCFDIVWGQDAWCYVTDKKRLIEESYRVLKPGGKIAFTDWLQVNEVPLAELNSLNSFMVFPYMETLGGYIQLLEGSFFEVIEKEDLSYDFQIHMAIYQKKLKDMKENIIQLAGEQMYIQVEKGIDLWANASKDGKVGRGRFIAQKNE